MTHQYSVEVQTYISEKLKCIRELKEKAKGEKRREKIAYYEGQTAELLEIRKYLSTEIDLKTQQYY